MVMMDADKKLAWKQHYEYLLNVEFTWNKDNLSPAKPVSGPPILITADMVSEAIKMIKPEKASGPSGIVAEMLKAFGDKVYNHLLPCKCYHLGKILFQVTGKKATSSTCSKVKVMPLLEVIIED